MTAVPFPPIYVGFFVIRCGTMYLDFLKGFLGGKKWRFPLFNWVWRHSSVLCKLNFWYGDVNKSSPFDDWQRLIFQYAISAAEGAIFEKLVCCTDKAYFWCRLWVFWPFFYCSRSVQVLQEEERKSLIFVTQQEAWFPSSTQFESVTSRKFWSSEKWICQCVISNVLGPILW